ncbi:MAG: caffeoyl-CoA O-methyltransferase [Acidimicrobiaceae bacterium]|jgi:caffeoyl-CoA O-methyltransferase|nr:caffeoyl-CoA O-methyltransferase [Acidimicrobiaceae bacterium]MDQ1419911.1 caffeoyl-CoA O-methyltransferase [Acidimicrobiaceae bacterium]MDQ1443101.1 caffeoyl-CoA O-methyltransferase [Acidimicrobiaceae bacterium]
MAEPDVYPRILAYLVAHSTPPDELVQRLIAETAALGGVATMQISTDEGAFLTNIARLARTTNAVEVGTFTGYSAICIARGMTPGGHLLCCDVSEEWTNIARRYWSEAGLADRIELRLGPAADTLRSLADEPTLDLAFLDADKLGYPTYWEELVPRMRPGGAIIVDNVLQRFQVLDDAATNENVVAIRRFNDQVVADERVDVAMLPIRDGVTLAVKR